MNLEYDAATGLLLPGEFSLSRERFEEEFVYNNKRKVIYGNFQKLLKIFRLIECTHLYLDGSFVTKKPLPNDIDVAWHMDDDIDKRIFQLETLMKDFPYLFSFSKEDRVFCQSEFNADVFPANTKEGASGLMFKDFFQKDKLTQVQKGIVIFDLR